MKNLFLFFVIFISLTGCAQNSGTIKIRQFYPVKDTSIDKNAKDIDKVDYYIVANYLDNKESDSAIEEFTKAQKNSAWMNYKSYQMVFYKESENTNEESVRKNPRILDRYSQKNDWIFLYTWSQGQFAGRFKVRNGEYVDPPSNIKVEDKN